MKEIIKEVKILMGVYLRYRLIITNDKIELKLTPISNSEDEVNWAVDNSKDGKMQLMDSLRNLVSRHGL